MRHVIRYLVFNACVFSEAVLYHGSLRFLAMNPAVLVLLWIRLSSTYGYPAAYTGLSPPRMRIYEKISQFKEGRSLTIPTRDCDGTANINLQSSTRPHSSTLSLKVAMVNERLANVQPIHKTSPHIVNKEDAHNNNERGRPQTESNDTRIISIVRVSSTSVVKPKRSERVTKSVSETRNYFNAISTLKGVKTANIINETKLENAVTPSISLLRKNRFDVYENDPRETSASSTIIVLDDTVESVSWVTTMRSFSEESSVNNNEKNQDLSTSTSSSASSSRYTFHRHSKSINDTIGDEDDSTEVATVAIEQYTDDADALIDRRNHQDLRRRLYDQHAAAALDGYESTERNYAQPEDVYGEPEKVYGEPEKIYGEPERVYGEPEQVHGQLERTHEQAEKAVSVDEVKNEHEHEEKEEEEEEEGETERAYDEDEKYKSETMHDDPETEFVKQENHFGLGLPESAQEREAGTAAGNSYSLFTTRVNDKKSSFIIDNGTHRKYRVEEKTPDGFIVGEYGMVSHRDGSLRGVRYTADSNINPSLIYQALVKFLSLK